MKGFGGVRKAPEKKERWDRGEIMTALRKLEKR